MDPPPVVQLRILEGEAKRDITFSYNANFFLYTTLEHARPIAQGRVPSTAQASFPVLTGTPVAGIAYLDRPDLAGYFVFPDLSVRHEGKYRLSFNLYEEVKDLKDADAEPAGTSSEVAEVKHAPMAPQNHVHYRLEVKSMPFSVFSAKRFPGLTESTNISRIVAEQGCRVRIRRDVRMRRRDVKLSKGGHDWDDEPAPAYAQAPQQPARPRSSNSTYSSFQQPPPAASQPQGSKSSYPLKPLSQSGLKLQGVIVAYNTPQQPPLPSPQSKMTNSSYSSFQQSSISVAQPETIVSGYSPFQQVPQSAPQTQSTNSSYTSFQTHSQSAPQSQGAITYNSFQQASQLAQQPQSMPSYTSHLSFGGSIIDQYQDRAFQPLPPSSQLRQGNTPKDGLYKHAASMHSHQMTTSQNVGYSQAQTLQSNQQNAISQIQTSEPITQYGEYNQAQIQHLPVQQPGDYTCTTGVIPGYDGPETKYSYGPTQHSTNSTVRIATKRAFGTVFSSDHLTQSMHSGMRPAAHHESNSLIEAEDGSVWDEYDAGSIQQLTYKRADGSRNSKKYVITG